MLVTITLLIIVIFLLVINHGSMVEALIILITIPFSFTGAVWLLAALDYNISIAVGVGMIVLAAEMGVLMMLYLGLGNMQ